MGRKQGWCQPDCTGTWVLGENRSAAWVYFERLFVDLAGSVTTSKRSPRFLFIFKLTYKRAVCPPACPAGIKDPTKMTFAIRFNAVLSLHPIPGPSGVSVPSLRGRPWSAASSQALREAGGGNAAVQALGLQAG